MCVFAIKNWHWLFLWEMLGAENITDTSLCGMISQDRSFVCCCVPQPQLAATICALNCGWDWNIHIVPKSWRLNVPERAFISRTPTNVRPVWVCNKRTLCRYLWKPHQSGTAGIAGGRKRAEWIPQSKDHRCTPKKPVFCRYNAIEMVKWFRWLNRVMLWQILCCTYVTLIFQTSSNLSQNLSF